MKRKLIIKTFKTSAKSTDKISKIIVVGYNTKVNGYYIEKLGHFMKYENSYIYVLNLHRLAIWVTRGAFIKSRVSWAAGIIGHMFLKKKKMLNKENKKLLWSPRFFYSFGKVRSIIGFDVSAIYRMFGRVYLFEGLCVSMRGKKGGLLSSSMVLRRKIHNHYVFFKFFIYFGSSFRYKVTGFSFKRKFIHYSKISYARL